MRVALVHPPIVGHKIRGTGIYADRLYKSLKAIKGLEVIEVNADERLSSFDLVHFPYFDPFFLTLPSKRPYKNIITVHDLIPLKFPRFFPKGIRGEIKWQIQRFLLGQSSCILTDSIASREDIVKFTGIAGGKIKVVYLGVDSDFKLVNDKKTLAKTAQKLKLPQEFLLFVGDVNYNKNITGLIKAFALVRKTFPEMELVLIGNGFIKETVELTEINNLISELNIGKVVHCLGFLEKEDLINVYNLGRVYIQPSFAEGFGLPVLEAMACGCPTIVANTSSLPELAGDASMLVSPYSTEEIANGIMTVLKDKVKRVELTEKGLERVKSFTWDKCARVTAQIYKEIVS